AERVVVEASSGIARPTVAALVIRDAANALIRKMDHLVLPEIRIDGPAVDEDRRLARAPLAVKEARAIARLDKRLEARSSFRVSASRPRGRGVDAFGHGQPRGRCAVEHRPQERPSVHDPYLLCVLVRRERYGFERRVSITSEVSEASAAAC